LEDLEEKWGKKYPASIGFWRNNWTQLSTYFKYPSEIRKLIYTTNSIENFNRQLRKVTKSKTIFPTDDALFKMLYLAMMDATKKMDRKGLGLGSDTGSVMHLFWGSDPARGYRLSTDPIAYQG